MTQDMNHTYKKALRAVLVAAIMSLTGSNALAQSTGVKVNGSVYGGGNQADVKVNTEVNISAGQVDGNVYGGGKLGSVGTYVVSNDMRNFMWTNDADPDPDSYTYNNTGVCNVTISGGTIGTGVNMSDEGSFDNGNVFGAGEGVANTFWCEKGIVYKANVSITAGTVNGNVYGGGEVGRVETDARVTLGTAGTPASGTEGEEGYVAAVPASGPDITGNVFGGGAGVKTHGYSALVRGNTYVTAQGIANVEHNVYGGGQVAAVGKYYLVDAAYKDAHPESNLEIGMPYSLVSDALGICNVTVKGDATITGSVFGGGKGKEPENYTFADNDHRPKRMMSYNTALFTETNNSIWEFADANGKYVWEYFDTETKYQIFLETLGLTTQSKITIGGTRNNDDTVTPSGSPTINGNVYGGSESGFVQHNTYVTIAGGTIGTTTTGGNVFGGGLGLTTFAEAGRVRGNTNLTITSGDIYGNVYGGGSLGDVGTIDKTDQENGQLTYNYAWKQSDGTTANVDENNTHNNTANTGICTVTISGGTIGDESRSTANHASGHVFGAGKGSEDTWWCEKAIAFATNVSIKSGTVYGNVYGGGQVGRVEDDAKVTIGTAGAPASGTEGEEGYVAAVPASGPSIRGDVFGAGAGLHTHGYSALVRGNSNVTVQGTTQVGGSVYGGGEIASVGRFTVVGGLPKHPDSGGTCIVNIKDNAQIGTSGTGHNVYGACKGVDPSTIAPSERKSMQLRKNAPKDNSLWSDYNNDPTSPFIWRTYATDDDYRDFLKTLALTSHPHVTIGGTWTWNESTETITASSETPTVYGSVYGGGQRGVTLGAVDVNIVGGTIEQDVYGGGALADTNCGNWDADSYVEVDGLIVDESVVTGLYIRTGTNTENDPYVYTEVTDADAKAAAGTTYCSKGKWHDATQMTALYTTTVDLTGGLVKGDAYGGGLGQKTGFNSATTNIEAVVWGDIAVTLNGTKFDITKYTEEGYENVVKSGRVFGCNNLNGSPQGNVTVTVEKTVAGNSSRSETANKNNANATYEVAAVYGGGNLANYTATGKKTHVIINGCDATSIQYVYGGGNAAAVPETDVDINAAYELGYVFGGGNGKDQYTLDGTTWINNPGANVNGNATTMIYGGTIHEAFGGSNENGVISGSVSIDTQSGGSCPLSVGKIYGAGKNADIEGDLIVILGCMPGDENKTDEVYGGAENANVKGDVELTITSGSFGKVFGGNNQSGAIFGHIKLNIEETGCNPIKIDELYLGGYNAAYSVYGYYHAKDEDDQLLYVDTENTKPLYRPRTSANDENTIVTFESLNSHTVPNATTHQYDDPELNIISATRIGKVFGGGLGADAIIYGNPTVNINQIYRLQSDGNGGYTTVDSSLGSIGVDATGSSDDCGVFGGGNQAKVVGNTTINIGTKTAVQLHKSYDKTTHQYSMSGDQTVLGVNILSNVYGGGNLADVTGNTFVNICAKKESESGDSYEAVAEGTSGVTIGGTVFGGGKGKEDTFLCEKAMIGENNKGAEIENYPNGNTSVRIGHGTVKGSVYGGGEVGRVEMNTVVEIGYGNGGAETKSPVIEGNVFGAGKGVKTHGYSALVRGNPHVTIQGDTWVKKSVYGGGEIASVARYRVAQTDAEGEPYGVEKGEPYLLANSNSGYCYVTVKGNAEIGTSGMKMYHPEKTDGTDKPDDWGHVFAAGKGVLPETYNYADYLDNGSNRTNYPKRMMLYDSDKYPDDKENITWEYVDPEHKETNKNIWEYFNTEEKYFKFVRTLGLATQTNVIIGDDASEATDNPLIFGSVYGGSENGIVQFDTDVYIKSGQIGCGDGETGRYSNWPTEDESFDTSWAECASWVYGLDTNFDGTKDLFAPYDPNANATGDLDKYPKVDAQSTAQSTQGGRRIATDGHTYYGNVFGGGSGSIPYFDNLKGISRYIMSAGQVKGNTNVTITGGHILTNVYGGCEATNVDGTATVTMKGGTIGVPRTDTNIIAHPLTGYLFGGGKGDQRIFFNKDTNVKDAVVTVEGGRIYGSVYGGGEDGHVLGNVTMIIGKTGNTGPKIGTAGTSYYDGHVFGGGRGFGGEALTAGNVGGAVELDILGGDILGSVYGGGRLASVGYGLYLTTETGYGIMRADDEYDGSYTNPSTDEASTFFDKGRGHIIMNISGGTIGNDSEYGYDANNTLTHTKGGNVFAGGMGRMYKLDGTPNTSVDWRKIGCVKSTKLTISGSTVIKSCVYGGGELGQVVGTQKGSDTKGTDITIKGGTIGTEIKNGDVTQYTFGSVFGGGYGSDVEDITVTVDGVETVTKPKLEAGLVKYDTNIDMQGGFVKASIYGGGEMASVGSVTEGESPTVTGSSYVTVSGGSVGIDRVALNGGGYKYFGGATMGNVYGGGSGLRTIVRSGRIMKNATVNINGGRIYHNVYGGGAFGTVGHFEYKEDDTANKKVTAINGLKTTGTGVATVTITDGTFGTSGRENGMVFGSSRGEVGEERDDWLAWTYDTHVTIGKEGGTGPQINGSVYGGGENGHTWNDAEVIIHGGTIGIPSGEKITMDGIEYDGARFPNRGNVYGGGCGTDVYDVDHDNDANTPVKKYYNPLAGVVYGKATVTMDGGHVVHNVYGAGAMGSVGRFTFDNNSSNTIPDGKPVGLADENTNNGLCYVTISGGKIGMTDMKMKYVNAAGESTADPDNFGHVFGAGRGEVKDTTVYTNLPVVGYIKESHVEINSGAIVTGSVYGGAESGHVLGDTYVEVKGGQIGWGEGRNEVYSDTDFTNAFDASGDVTTSLAECAHWDYHTNDEGSPYDKYDYEEGHTVATDGHTFYGNVFGGGSGYYPYAAGKWVRSAGIVEGSTHVTISGGHILTNVYGGNEQTDVNGSCTVTMTGGTVGVPLKWEDRKNHPITGNLFGAGKGDKRTLFNTWTNVASTTVSVSKGRVYGSVFGGGEDGHVLGNASTTVSGEQTIIGTLGTSGYDGNVFGGGRGSFMALTAGVVGGNVTLNIENGKVMGSVFGGGRLASVGTHFANPKLENGDDNPLYGTMQSGANHGNIIVNISGGTIGALDATNNLKSSTFSIGEVFGGCKGTTSGTLKDKLGVAKTATVNMLGGTVGKAIYGGGEVGNIGEGEGASNDVFTKVNLLGGTVVDVYGGGLGQKNASQNIDARAYVKGNATVNLNGMETADYVEAIHSPYVNSIDEDGTVGVDFYRTSYSVNEGVITGKSGCVVTGNIFGCNNVNGTPTGHAKVHVFMTTPKTGQLDTEYDISAIYGGGNQADYDPVADDKTEVIIEGCGLTKILQVYGGGNAAASPGTSVLIKGTELIDEVFGGGNGVSTETFDNPGANVGFHTDKSNYTVGDGKAYVQLMAGTVNYVYGGSNSNGDIRGGSVITKPTPEYTVGVTSCCEELSVNQIFGGGKSADMRSGAEIVLGCMPNDWIEEIYAGAENANVSGDVSLTLTSGKFGRVFGGNKTSGRLEGSITVNIEEDGQCGVPIIIGELYGGGNKAAYSVYGYDDSGHIMTSGTAKYKNPQVNVHAFTSIGNIFGGGYGDEAVMYGSPEVNINEVLNHTDAETVFNGNEYTTGETLNYVNDVLIKTAVPEGVTPYTVTLPTHEDGKIGAIGSVFGGGNAAKVFGNTNVNIGTKEKVFVVKPVAVGNSVTGLYKRVKDEDTGAISYDEIITDITAEEDTNYYQLKPVVGADIRGNVYGGGNQAEVTGNTNVNIGKRAE